MEGQGNSITAMWWELQQLRTQIAKQTAEIQRLQAEPAVVPAATRPRPTHPDVKPYNGENPHDYPTFRMKPSEPWIPSRTAPCGGGSWKQPTNAHRYHQRLSGDECWRPVKHLGHGSFGDVWQETCVSGPSENAVRVVKHLHKRQSRFLEMSRRELDALVAFSDAQVAEYKQHFVQFIGWFDDPEHFYLAMEFLEHTILGLRAIWHRNYMTTRWTHILQLSMYGHLGPSLFACEHALPPFQTIKHLLDYARDHRAKFPIRPLRNSSGFCMNFVLGTMADLPERRLAIEHVLAHEWLSEQSNIPDSIRCTSSTTWGMPPSNAWSTTYDSASPQQPYLSYFPLMTESIPSLPSPQQQQKSGYSLVANPGQTEVAEDNKNSVTSIKALDRSRQSAINAKADFAIIYREQKMYDRAEIVGREVIKLRQQMLGDKHLETIEALENLAATYREQEKYDELEYVDIKVLDLRQETLGNKHPATIDAMENLAARYRKQHKFDEAQTTYEKIYILRHEALGSRHPDTITSLETLREVHKTCKPNFRVFSTRQPIQFQWILGLLVNLVRSVDSLPVDTYNSTPTTYFAAAGLQERVAVIPLA
ncbi:hypothetical protein BDW59DRAFT_163076 [Aspergillus cavernicola]|uniref:Protein kinase domain-containing protein n=1 Tax=Aspergillus cavernicola TaxID=176166 RepID=A0ABR4I8Z9_9EURO